MIVRALDGTGDWLFGKGQNDYKSGKNAISQNIQTRLNSFLGDCFFDLSAGIDWFNLLGAKNQLAINIAVSAVIINTPNVKSLLELSLVLSQARLITITYSVDTVSGVITNQIVSSGGNTSRLVTESGLVLVTEAGDPITIEP